MIIFLPYFIAIFLSFLEQWGNLSLPTRFAGIPTSSIICFFIISPILLKFNWKISSRNINILSLGITLMLFDLAVSLWNQISIKDYIFVFSKLINLFVMFATAQYVQNNIGYYKRNYANTQNSFLLSIILLVILQILGKYSIFQFTSNVNRNEIILFMFPFLFFTFSYHTKPKNFLRSSFLFSNFLLWTIFLQSRSVQILTIFGFIRLRILVVTGLFLLILYAVFNAVRIDFLLENTRYQTVISSLAILIEVIMTDTINYSNTSQEGDRIMLLLGATRIFLDNFWFGIGQGLSNYREELSHYLDFYRMTRPHSLYVSSLATRGVLGTGVLILFFYSMFVEARKKGNIKIISLISVFWLFNEYFEHPLIWLTIGMTISLSTINSKNV